MLYLFRKKGDVKSMTKKIRYTYRPPEELYDALAREANRKQMAINSVITTILWKNYFPDKKQYGKIPDKR